jgi:hypothetical protein
VVWCEGPFYNCQVLWIPDNDLRVKHPDSGAACGPADLVASLFPQHRRYFLDGRRGDRVVVSSKLRQAEWLAISLKKARDGAEAPRVESARSGTTLPSQSGACNRLSMAVDYLVPMLLWGEAFGQGSISSEACVRLAQVVVLKYLCSSPRRGRDGWEAHGHPDRARSEAFG